MGKVVLETRSKGLFGKYMPNVFVNKVFIERERNESGIQQADGNFQVTSYLTITLTKDDNEANPIEYIQDQLDKIYLYSWLSADEARNQDLLDSKLNIRDVLYSDIDNDDGSRWTTMHLCPMRMRMDRLSSFLGTPDSRSSFGSYLVETGAYDESGNELIQIQNIKVSLEVELEAGDGDATVISSLANAMTDGTGIEKVFVFFACGIDYENIADGDENAGYYDKDVYDKSSAARIEYETNGGTYPGPQPLVQPAFISGGDFFNNNFGDITYEHILDKNFVPSAIEEIFVEAETDAIYMETPLKTFDGKYHKAEPVDHLTIVETFNNLIDSHAEQIDLSPRLKENIVNLQYVLETEKDTPDLIPKLQLFRRTYSTKSTATKSGEFYNRFSPLLNVINGRVGLQPRLLKKLIYNGKIFDLRRLAVGMSYWGKTPNPPYSLDDSSFYDHGWDEDGSTETYLGVSAWRDTDITVGGTVHIESSDVFGTDISVVGSMQTGDPAGSGRPYTPTMNWYQGNEYIPIKWSQMSRQNIMTAPVAGGNPGDFKEFLTEEGWGYIATSTFGSTLGTDDEDKVEDMQDEKSDDVAEARSALYDIYLGSAIGSDMDPIPDGREAGSGLGSGDDLYADFATKNHGIVLFDWEKALHTQSNLGYICSLSKLQRLFRLTIPYHYFRVKQAKMIRRELHFNSQGFPEMGVTHGDTFETPPDPEDPTPHTSIIVLELDMDDNKPYPANKTFRYKADFDRPEMGMPYVYNYSDVTISFAFDGYEGYALPEQDKKQYAYLKFVDFDVIGNSLLLDMAVGPESTVGSSYDSAHWFDRGFGQRLETYNSYETSFISGLKVKDGYRLMCFEYADYMDDDVAFFNTVGASGDSPGSIHLGFRPHHLENLSVTGVPATEYIVMFEVEDTTIDFFYNFMVKNLINTYNRFMDHYYNRAKEYCSYNNLGEHFNEFFGEALMEEAGSIDKQAAIEAVVVYNLWRELLFSSFSTGTTHDADMWVNMTNNTQWILNELFPPNGTMGGLEGFVHMFEKLINVINPVEQLRETHGYTYHPVFDRALQLMGLNATDVWDSFGGSAMGGLVDFEDFGATHIRSIKFYNTLPILAPIAGNARYGAYSGDTLTGDIEWEYVTDFEPEDTYDGSSTGWSDDDEDVIPHDEEEKIDEDDDSGYQPPAETEKVPPVEFELKNLELYWEDERGPTWGDGDDGSGDLLWRGRGAGRGGGRVGGGVSRKRTPGIVPHRRLEDAFKNIEDAIERRARMGGADAGKGIGDGTGLFGKGGGGKSN